MAACTTMTKPNIIWIVLIDKLTMKPTVRENSRFFYVYDK